MITYRLEALDDEGNAVYAIPGDIGTLDGVLVFQIADGICVPEAEMQRTKAALRDAFPNRRILILASDIRFVRFVPVDQV